MKTITTMPSESHAAVKAMNLFPHKSIRRRWLPILGMTAALLGGWNVGAAIVFEVPSGTDGQQSISGGFVIGMDFDVNNPVTIVQLGAYDAGGNGFAGTLTVGIFNRDTGLLYGSSLTFTPDDAGTLIGGSRFKTLSTPFTLPAGFHGSIVEWWNNGNDQNGNRVFTPNHDTTFNTVDGSLALVQHADYGYSTVFPATYPPTGFTSHPYPGAPFFTAGTFAVSAVPEPSTWIAGALLGLPFGLQGVRYFRKR